MSEKKKGPGLVGKIFALAAKSAKLLKLFKVAKPMVMFLSMSVSVIAYAFWMGPWLSIVFVALLLVHEMGHVVAMRMRGYETPTPVFIPFLGAAIFAPKGMDRDTEAFIGFGGPLLGTIGALVVFGLWFLLPRNEPSTIVILVGSYLGVYLNLFNLIAISPLDGGRVTQAAGRWFKYAGLIGLVAFSLWWKQPVVLYVWIIVLYDFYVIPVKMRAVLVTGAWIAMVALMSLGYGYQPFWVNVVDCVITLFFVLISILRTFRKAEDVEPDTRPDLTPAQRTKWALVYSGLATVLTVMVIFQSGLLPHH